MAKTDNINIRIEPELKKESEKIFNYLGLTMAEAVKIFLTQVTLTNSIPFKIEIPKYNNETLEAMMEDKEIKNNPNKHKGFKNIENLMEDLNKVE